jgi:hypothetical protein
MEFTQKPFFPYLSATIDLIAFYRYESSQHYFHIFLHFFTFILYYLRMFKLLTVVRKNKCEKNVKKCENNVEKMW